MKQRGKRMWAAAMAACVAALGAGCSSSGGGHRVYTGPDYLKDPTLAWIKQGAACTAAPIPRPFDPKRDRITLELRPATGYRGGMWFGVDEWGREVGGYLQLIKPWPIPEGYDGAYTLKCVIYCDPSLDPQNPDGATAYHELGGHANLVPSGIYDHPPRFKACYPFWRLALEPLWPGDQTPDLDGPIGPQAIYGGNGELLHECGGEAAGVNTGDGGEE
jgi:hypothetical protein